jgi:hypothetical protein
MNPSQQIIVVPAHVASRLAPQVVSCPIALSTPEDASPISQLNTETLFITIYVP